MIENLTFALHLMCVCLAAGIPSYCWIEDVARCFRRRRDVGKGDLSPDAKFMWHAVAWLVGGAITGLVYGWMIWNPSFAYALQLLGSRIPYAIVEYVTSLLLYGVCAALFMVHGRHRRWIVFGRIGLLLVAITNLAYHFPALFRVITTLKDHPPASGEFGSADFRRLIFSWESGLALTHFCTAAAIVSGLYVLTSAESNWRCLRQRVISWIMIVAIACQWCSGIAMYLALPRARLFQLHSLETFAGTIAWMLATVALTVSLIGLHWFRIARGWLWATWGLTLLNLLAMAWLARS